MSSFCYKFDYATRQCQYCKKGYQINKDDPTECTLIDESDICNLYDVNELCIECKEQNSVPINYINENNINKIVCVEKPKNTWMEQTGVYAVSQSESNLILFNEEFCLSNSNNFILDQIDKYEGFYFLDSKGRIS